MSLPPGEHPGAAADRISLRGIAKAAKAEAYGYDIVTLVNGVRDDNGVGITVKFHGPPINGAEGMARTLSAVVQALAVMIAAAKDPKGLAGVVVAELFDAIPGSRVHVRGAQEESAPEPRKTDG